MSSPSYLCGRRLEADSIEPAHAAPPGRSDGADLVHVLQQVVGIQRGFEELSRLFLLFYFVGKLGERS